MSVRRRLLVTLAAAVATATLAATPAQAVPGVPSAVFDPNSVGWLSLRDQTSAQFAASFATHSGNGFMITDLDIEVVNGDYRVGSVWQSNTDDRGWQELRDLTDAEFHDAWVAASQAGMRLVEQETYILNGSRRYAGVWIENVENLTWTSARYLTSAQFSQMFSAQAAAGRMPIDIDVYDTGVNGIRYSVIWVQNAEGLNWIELRDLTSAEFSEKFNQFKDDYRMVAFDSVLTGAGQRYAMIMFENANGRGWAEKRDLTSAGFGTAWQQFASAGYRLVSYDRYETAAGTRYAGIWREN